MHEASWLPCPKRTPNCVANACGLVFSVECECALLLFCTYQSHCSDLDFSICKLQWHVHIHVCYKSLISIYTHKVVLVLLSKQVYLLSSLKIL
jgi:hypothetical protein